MDVLMSKAALTNAVAGAASDMFSSVVLYPIDYVKVRMQADSKVQLVDILKEMVAHPLQVYNGIDVKLLLSVQQKFQYFYVNVLLKEFYRRKFGREIPLVVDLAIGYVTALQGLGTSLPLEVVQTRMITSKKRKGGAKARSASQVFLDQMEGEGVSSFYKTLPASLLLCINPAVTFVIFDAIKTRLLRGRVVDGHPARVLGSLEALFVSILAKTIATLLTFPVIRSKVIMSLHRGEKNAPASQNSLFGTLTRILQEEGVGGLYAGLIPQLLKAVTSAALLLVMKERIYELIRRIIMGSTK